jgi:hypothetical protein
VIVSKLAEHFTKNNLKYIMKCVILSLKNKKIIWTLSSIFEQDLISVKTHQMKTIQTRRYSLKHKN